MYSRLLEVARQKVVEAAKQEAIPLRQCYARVGPELAIKAGRYAHAKQFKRMRRVLRKQRTILGRLLSDIGRKKSRSLGVAGADADKSRAPAQPDTQKQE